MYHRKDCRVTCGSIREDSLGLTSSRSIRKVERDHQWRNIVHLNAPLNLGIEDSPKVLTSSAPHALHLTVASDRRTRVVRNKRNPVLRHVPVLVPSHQRSLRLLRSATGSVLRHRSYLGCPSVLRSQLHRDLRRFQGCPGCRSALNPVHHLRHLLHQSVQLR